MQYIYSTHQPILFTPNTYTHHLHGQKPFQETSCAAAIKKYYYYQEYIMEKSVLNFLKPTASK